MALYNSPEEIKKIMAILRDKMGISNMDQSKKLVIPKDSSMYYAKNHPVQTSQEGTYEPVFAETTTVEHMLKQMKTVQASQASTFVEPRINPSDYDLNQLISEQARLSLCCDVAQAKLNQATQAVNDAEFAREQHMNLIKAVMNAMVDNIKKVLK